MLEHRFFRYFPPEHAKQLAKTAHRVTFPAHQIIFEENDPSDAIYLVLSGRVEILKHSSGDHYHTLAYASEDDYFGELGVLDGSGRSARTITLTEVTAAVLPRPGFLRVLSRCPWETTMGLFMQVVENLRETNSRYVEELIRKEKITLIGEMANSILHDFRSPVTSIQLALGTITKHSADETTRLACATIERQLRRMGAMVEEVLEFARGETRLDRRPVLLRDLFADLVSINGDLLRNAGIALRVHPTKAVAALDHGRMVRVLQNLLSNAIEAIGSHRKGVVVLSARRRGRRCEITMSDNGPGIPKVIWSKLFQPFTTYGKQRGTGLGLAISKAIVEAHGGEISFESRKGVGTTFRIRLPLPA